jgi:hypothetical protein
MKKKFLLNSLLFLSMALLTSFSLLASELKVPNNPIQYTQKKRQENNFIVQDINLRKLPSAIADQQLKSNEELFCQQLNQLVPAKPVGEKTTSSKFKVVPNDPQVFLEQIQLWESLYKITHLDFNCDHQSVEETITQIYFQTTEEPERKDQVLREIKFLALTNPVQWSPFSEASDLKINEDQVLYGCPLVHYVDDLIEHKPHLKKGKNTLHLGNKASAHCFPLTVQLTQQSKSFQIKILKFPKNLEPLNEYKDSVYLELPHGRLTKQNRVSLTSFSYLFSYIHRIKGGK